MPVDAADIYPFQIPSQPPLCPLTADIQLRVTSKSSMFYSNICPVMIQTMSPLNYIDINFILV